MSMSDKREMLKAADNLAKKTNNPEMAHANDDSHRETRERLSKDQKVMQQELNDLEEE